MNRKGQALVEFVLILPLFIMLLFAIIDFGNILNQKSKLENMFWRNAERSPMRSARQKVG